MKFVTNVMTHVRCQLREAVIATYKELNQPGTDIGWLRDWSAQITLTMNVDEKTDFNPGVTLTKLFPDLRTRVLKWRHSRQPAILRPRARRFARVDRNTGVRDHLVRGLQGTLRRDLLVETGVQGQGQAVHRGRSAHLRRTFRRCVFGQPPAQRLRSVRKGRTAAGDPAHRLLPHRGLGQRNADLEVRRAVREHGCAVHRGLAN